MSRTEANLQSDLLPLLLRRWKTLLAFVALTTSAAIVYSFVAQEWYEARLTVVPSTPSRDSAMLAFASKLPGVDPVSTDSKRIEAVLASVSVTDAVIDRFNLVDRYSARFRENARRALWDHCSTSVDKKSGLVTLTCEDTDPSFVQKMTSYFGEVGNRVFARVSASSAKEEARFLEQQVTNARKEVDEASRRLREFQEKNRIIDLPEQSKAVISAMASLKGELLSKQLEHSYVRSFSASTEPRVAQLSKQIEILESQLRALEAQHDNTKNDASSASTGSDSNFFPEAMSVPELRFELEQLLREQAIKQTVYALMTERFETAKVDAARETSTFQVLDYPTLPTMRSRPVRRKLAMLGVLGGLLLGATWIALPVWWRKRSSGLVGAVADDAKQ
jgi:capsule polysaccharide export protein KpsE/RkpR